MVHTVVNTIYKEDNKMIVELHTLPRTRFDSGYTSPNKEIEVTIIDTSNPDILANLTEGELWIVRKVITEETTITIGNTIATPKRG